MLQEPRAYWNSQNSFQMGTQNFLRKLCLEPRYPQNSWANTHIKLRKSRDSRLELINCSQVPSDAARPTRTLSGMVKDEYMEFSQKMGSEPWYLQICKLTSIKKFKNCLISISELVKCCRALFDTVGPTRTLSRFVMNRYVEFSEKNRSRAMTTQKSWVNSHEKLRKSPDSYFEAHKMNP